MLEADDAASRRHNLSGPTHLAVSWQTVAVCATAVAIASLGVLVVVAHRQGADLLATTALEVALIAFIVQFMVFIAQ